MFEKDAEIEFQKLPLTEREKFVSVVQVWNKAFVSGANIGFQKGTKSRLNITTISDAPIDKEQEKNDFDVLRGKILELDKHNTRLQKACHKWFMRWREAKKDAVYFDARLQEQIQATLKLQKENAELKEKLNKIERKCKFNFVDLLHDVENESKLENQLTKAKELLKRCYDNYIYLEPLRSEIEQFLSEVENE